MNDITKSGLAMLFMLLFGLPTLFLLIAVVWTYPAMGFFLFAFFVLIVTFAPKGTK